MGLIGPKKVVNLVKTLSEPRIRLALSGPTSPANVDHRLSKHTSVELSLGLDTITT